MQIANYLEKAESSEIDEKTGVSISRLTYDELFSLYFAAIRPGMKLPAHYHDKGVEAYHIVSGEGEIKVGSVVGASVEWLSVVAIKAGDCFSIQAGQVHSLVNSGDIVMRVVFSAPPSHLGEDRTFITITQ